MNAWFRVYNTLVDDPKVRKLPDHLVASLLWLWCIAGENDGVLPPIDDVAFKLRCAPAKAAEIITKLCRAGLLDNNNGVFTPHNWGGRQYKVKDGKPEGDDGKGGKYIYFAAGTGPVVKIGFSKNPWARLAELQTGYPEKLTIVATFKTKTFSETEIHTLLAAHRKQGEWFDLPVQIMEIISTAHTEKVDYAALLLLLRSQLRDGEARSSYAPPSEQNRADQSRAEQTRAAAVVQAGEGKGTQTDITVRVLKTDLMDAFGGSARCPDLTRASDWIAKGYAPSMIVEVVRERLAKNPDVANLAYFDKALAERHDKRAPTPSERAAGVDAATMDWALGHFMKGGHWSRQAGPEPGQPGCKATNEQLEKHGLGHYGKKQTEHA